MRSWHVVEAIKERSGPLPAAAQGCVAIRPWHGRSHLELAELAVEAVDGSAIVEMCSMRVDGKSSVGSRKAPASATGGFDSGGSGRDK
ncbi:hypothetical protein C8034_v005190 [Colletotrichum sidae]|uniref:Uncharacterized protein n=1 Tax=Colletotrichum sidae TaxID=1347389 RepID=A0A4R8TU43_9PEZI|nr:hypothetical protein C8034_v005190 [Colletotrichum sidae]